MTKQELDRLYNRVQQRKWREENPERSMEYQQQYLAKNRDHINKIHRKRKYLISKGFPHKWISVSDFLPNEGIPVLAHIKFEEKQLPGEDYGILIWDGDTWSGGEWVDAPVTHWARLPQPPEGGEKGE